MTFTFFHPLAQMIHFLIIILDVSYIPTCVCVVVVSSFREPDLKWESVSKNNCTWRSPYVVFACANTLFPKSLSLSWVTPPAWQTLKPGCLCAAPKVVKPAGQLIQLLVIRTSSCVSTEKSGCQSVIICEKLFALGTQRCAPTYFEFVISNYCGSHPSIFLEMKDREAGTTTRWACMSYHCVTCAPQCACKMIWWSGFAMIMGWRRGQGKKTIEKNLAALIRHKNWRRGSRYFLYESLSILQRNCGPGDGVRDTETI